MNLFHVQFTEFEDLAIFAKSARAARQLIDTHLSSSSAAGTQYHIGLPVHFSHMSRLEFYQLQAGLAMNMQGCGVYDRDMGWKIEPLGRHTLTPKLPLEHILEHISPTAPCAKPADTSRLQQGNDNHVADNNNRIIALR